MGERERDELSEATMMVNVLTDKTIEFSTSRRTVIKWVWSITSLFATDLSSFN